MATVAERWSKGSGKVAKAKETQRCETTLKKHLAKRAIGEPFLALGATRMVPDGAPFVEYAFGVWGPIVTVESCRRVVVFALVSFARLVGLQNSSLQRYAERNRLHGPDVSVFSAGSAGLR